MKNGRKVGKAIEKEIRNIPKAAKKLGGQVKAAIEGGKEAVRKIRKHTGGR